MPWPLGVWREDRAHDVVLHFAPRRAEDVLGHFFHATESKTEQSDGGVIVRFTASGQWEICWHLFTWGSDVEILAPDCLRETYLQLLAKAAAPLGAAVNSAL